MKRGQRFMNVILYSAGCPMCKMLETKLKQKNIEFETVSDKDIMIAKGFKSMPMLEVDGDIMVVKDALRWVNER